MQTRPGPCDTLMDGDLLWACFLAMQHHFLPSFVRRVIEAKDRCGTGFIRQQTGLTELECQLTRHAEIST